MNRASRMVLWAVVLVTATILAITSAFAGTTGVISGIITDAKTGAKLSGVNIKVNKTALSTVTDSKGFFAITNVRPDTYDVTASLIGYADASKTDIQVMMDATSICSISLEKKDLVEKDVVISGARSLLQPDITTPLYLIPARQERMVKNQPNNLYQIQGVVGTQPGVVLDSEGLPHIRGGRQEEIGYMIEGIPVMEPLTNMFGTNTVTVGMSRLQVYTGGYRAEYGNAISGILNEIKRTGAEVPGGRIEAAGGSQGYKSSYIEYGGVAPSGFDYYVGSYLWDSTFERMFMKGVESADTVGKFTYPAGNDKWTLLFNRGTARYYLDSVHDFTYLNEPVDPEEDHNHQAYSIVGLTYSHNFAPSKFVTIRPYIFKTASEVDSLAPDGPMGLYMNYGTNQRGLQTEYTDQISENHLLKAGWNTIASKNRYLAWIPDLGEAFGYPEWGDYHYTTTVNTLQTGAFVQDQAKLSNRLQAELGLRYDRMKFNKVAHADVINSQTSPRMGLSYKLDDNNLVKASWGKFIQFPPSYVMERLYENPGWENYRLGNITLKPQQSVSWDVSWEKQLGSNSVFKLTPFYKTYTDLLQKQKLNPADPDSFATVYVNSGQGRNSGVEAYYSKKFSKNWEGWLSYTWMKSKANASSFDATIDPNLWTYTDWDQRHTLSAVFSYRKNTWEHNFQFSYGSGLADSVDASTADRQSHAPAAAVLSWNITKKLPKKSWLGDQISLNIWNIFNTGKPTHYYTYMYPEDDTNPESPLAFYRDADSWVVPRFISLNVQRKF